MPRSYRHVKQYEKEILELSKQGLTQKEIGERFGMSAEQIKEFLRRHRRKERLIASGEGVKHKGRPCKKEYEIPPSIQRLDKLTQMRYVMASKDRYIKQLEMEIKLMQDFLSLTERK